ncbi:hypothetical protein MJO29_016432 [Puccinia striiformis f. sp. tritici]|uniref:25S rRNA adenine-N(1) methyltransferase n=1 Tax=Puccinia striiformis f. sp. tritici PST-78 TaxID=1165861 RepID=A0A0L0VZR9_9BASI|nr:hypothetical protein Pst134EA_030701 [Puccinia striiformis f. sp. tritici]KAH9446797.1 hypothetical protein Pst134EA_030701 [Puccinia striiformis f. sp. tritici]KAI7935169.1 hypothetical protein MJO29_016432 [Puccinia striiformis f. sp. tritici]KAI9603595.1 hypothetical protein KEM48_000895 [Puccinia striiformis f. sp. tritici PST-130]KNF04779.1 hypothetical protein PSTG_02256 [Puccinia striiformis f. sp. tritici PST-78]
MGQISRRTTHKKKNSLHSAILAKLSKKTTANPETNSQISSSEPSPAVLEEPTDLGKRKRSDTIQKTESASDVIQKKPKPSSSKGKNTERPQGKLSPEPPLDEVVEEETTNQQDEKKQKIERLIRKHSKEIKDDPSKLISEFHRIEKRLSQAKLDPITRHKLILEQKKLGGLEAYQTASKIGGAVENGGETGKWCAQTLINLGLRPSGPANAINKITLLDVGAIDGKSYAKYTDWISTTSIDINPIDESIVARCDFFQFPIPKTEDQKFDVVCLSLVLNFIGDLKKRGEMIKRARKFLKPTGKLFIVLPLACLNNSRYLDFERFKMILNHLGFKTIKQHNSSKLTYWLLEKANFEQPNKSTLDGDTMVEADDSHVGVKSHSNKSSIKFPKVEIRPGPSRNNFCIKV